MAAIYFDQHHNAVCGGCGHPTDRVRLLRRDGGPAEGLIDAGRDLRLPGVLPEELVQDEKDFPQARCRGCGTRLEYLTFNGMVPRQFAVAR